MNRKLTTFRRVVKTGATNFMRNLWLAVAAMAVMVVTLGIILVSLVASATFNHTIAQITDKIDVSMYLKDTVTDSQRQQLMTSLRSQPDIRGVSYVSKLDAFKAFSADRTNNADTLQALNEAGNPLPASIRIQPRNPSQLGGIAAYINRPEVKPLLDDRTPVSYSGDRKTAIDKIAHATNVMRQIGVGAVVVFAFISMLIIFNTIQMAIFNRRDELTIMRLLGATTWYIRGPFVVESIMYGVISAVISMLLMGAIFITASSALQASSLGLLDIGYANTYFHRHFLMLLTLQLAVGIVIGAVSSTIATRRYLKFKPQSHRLRN